MEKNYSKQVIFTTLEICSLIIFAIVGFVSAFLVYNYYESDRKVSEIQDEIKVAMDTSKDTEKEDKDEELDEDEKPIINNYDALLDINSDTVGWITVKNTKIDYPVAWKLMIIFIIYLTIYTVMKHNMEPSSMKGVWLLFLLMQLYYMDIV
jgi:sortase B